MFKYSSLKRKKKEPSQRIVRKTMASDKLSDELKLLGM